MIDPARLRRIGFRAWHRGTREADYVMGGFYDAHHVTWTDADCDWFEALIDEQDVDILAWAFGSAPPPDRYAGPLMEALRRLDYIKIERE